MSVDLSAAAPLLIVGPVTWDRFGTRRVPGGAAAYSARTAAALGLRAYVLTTAGADADLDALAGHELAVVPSKRTLTFAHHSAGGARRLRVLAAPDRPLTAADIPAGWPPPRTLILGPLLPDDVDVASFLDALAPGETALLAQGLQRTVTADGAVAERAGPAPALLAAARDTITLFLSAEETAGWAPGALDTLAARARRLVRTLGAEGAEVRTRDGVTRAAALPAAAVDATGAGDVFAAAFILAVRAGEDTAGRLAAACAAASVERRGPAPLPARAEIEARMAAAAAAPGERS